MPTDAAAELLAYAAYVAEMAARADGRVIKNSSLDHAEIIIAQIFKSSRETVDILTGSLDSRVYGSKRVIDAALGFIEREGAVVRIMAEDELPDDHPFLLAVRNLARDRVHVRRLSAQITTPSHFAIGDRQHIRLEADKGTCKADAMFGESALSGPLSDAYSEVFERLH